MRNKYYLRKTVAVLATFLAMALCLAFNDARASASEIDPSKVTWVSPRVLKGEQESPLVSYGYRVIYSHQNDSTFSANNLQTQCISPHMHATWYGLKAGACKHADASGAQFTVFNSATGQAVSKVDLSKVQAINPDSSINFGCVLAAANVISLIAGGLPAGWVARGVVIIVNAAGIIYSCR